jgi:hypothetical protein
VPVYHLHYTADDDLGLLQHPATNVEPREVVHLSDGRDALVAARAETNDEAIWALLEVLVAPGSPPIPTWRAVEIPAPS